MRRADWAVAAAVAVVACGQAIGSGLIAFQYDWAMPHSPGLLRDWAFQEWSVPQRSASGDWAPYPFELYLRTLFGLLALAGFDGDQVQKLFIVACAFATSAGIVALGRAFGQPAWKSGIVALCLLGSASLYNALALGYVTFMFSSAMLVLLLNAALRYFRGERRALAWLLLLTPFTWSQVQIGLFAIVAIVALACFTAAPPRRVLLASGAFAGYSIVAFAFVWLPYLLGYSRSSLPTANQSWVTLTAPTLYQLLADLPQDYPLHARALGRLLLPFEFLSALAALTALFNLRRARGRRRIVAAAIFLAVAAAAVFLQAGPALNLRLALWNAIPGIAIVRNPAYLLYAFWFLVLLTLCVTAGDRQAALLAALCVCSCVPLWNGSYGTTLQHVAVTKADEVAVDGRSLILPRPEPFAFKSSAAPGLSILAASDPLPAFITDQALPSYEANLLAQLVDRGDSADLLDGLMRLGGFQDALVLGSLQSRFTTYVHAGDDPWLSAHLTNAWLAGRLAAHQFRLSRGPAYDRYLAREPGGEVLRCTPVVALDSGSIRAAAAIAQAFPDSCVTAGTGAALRDGTVVRAADYGLHDERNVPLFVPATAASTLTGIDANTGWADVMSGQWWWFDARADAFPGTLLTKSRRRLTFSIRPPVDGTFFVRTLRWPGGPGVVHWTDASSRTSGVGFVGTANEGDFTDVPLGRARGKRTSLLTLRFDGGLVAVAGIGVAVRPSVPRRPDVLVVPDCDVRCAFELPPHPAPLAIRLVGNPISEPVRYRWIVTGSGAQLLARPTAIAVRDADRRLIPREEVVARTRRTPLLSSAVGSVAVPVSGAGVAGLLDPATGMVSIGGKGWSAVRSLIAPDRWYVSVPPDAARRRIVVTAGTVAGKIGKYDWVFGDFTSGNAGTAAGYGELTALGTTFSSRGDHLFGVHSQRIHLTHGHYRLLVATAACRGGPYDAKVFDERSSAVLGDVQTRCGRDFEVPFDVASSADVRVYVEPAADATAGRLTLGDAVLVAGNPYGVVAALRPALPAPAGIQRNDQYRAGARLRSDPGAVLVPSAAGMLLWIGGRGADPAWRLPAAALYRALLVFSAACEGLVVAYVAGTALRATRRPA